MIVLTCGRPARCADSIRHNAQTLAGIPAEIMVVNNGGGSLDLPARVGDVPCRVLEMPRNLGAEARNAALAAARGEYVLVLDDDAYFNPELAAAMVQVFTADAAVGAVACRIQNGTGEEASLLPSVFHGCACGFRREALHQVGGYPRGYLYYGEEYELAFRLYQAGYRLALCPGSARVLHVRDAGGRDVNRIIRLLLRNNTYLWAKYLPA